MTKTKQLEKSHEFYGGRHCFSYCSWPPVQQKSRLLIGLKCILHCLNNSSQVAKSTLTLSHKKKDQCDYLLIKKSYWDGLPTISDGLATLISMPFVKTSGDDHLTLSGPAFSVVRQARGGRGSEARMPKIKVNINPLK